MPEHDCPYVGVRPCCSTDFCEPCTCPDDDALCPHGFYEEACGDCKDGVFDA